MKRSKVIGGVVVIVILTAIGIYLATSKTGFKEGEISRIEDWKDDYPLIYESYMDNADMSKTTYGGSEPIDYLKEHPNLKTFYEGYGFSIEYLRARGHVYALDDVINTARPKPGASCLSCKTADFTVAVEEDGVTVNKIDFQEFLEDHPQTSTINCYDCHRNEPGKIEVTRAHLTKALAYVEGEESPNNQVCAQCHVEYYLEPVNKEVVLPWKDGIDTDDMLVYYDEINFGDWQHPTTGANLLKAQHPEFETFKDSIHDRAMLTCTSCHMPEILGDNEIKSHHWTSPLKSKEGLASACATCHWESNEDLIERVEGVQEKVFIKTNEVSNELNDFIERLSSAVADDAVKGNDLEELQDIHRRAQFKWDFVFVENSEGFHNSQKAHQNLDEARELVKEGIELIEKYGY